MQATMFRRPRLRRRLYADESSCGTCAIPGKTPGRQGSTIIRMQHDIPTPCHAIERKINASKPQRRAHATVHAYTQRQHHARTNALLCKHTVKITTAPALSLFHADHTYLRTEKHKMSKITSIYFMQRRRAQLQALTKATLEDMFNANA